MLYEVITLVAMLAVPLAVAKQPIFVSGGQMVTGFTPVDDIHKGKSANHAATAILAVEWTGDIAVV